MGEGGQGSVHSNPGGSLADRNEIRKIFLNTAKPNLEGLNALISWYENLPSIEKTYIDNHMSWPSSILVANGTVNGCLFRKIPDNYYVHRDGSEVELKFSFLQAPVQAAQRSWLPVVNGESRLRLVTKFLEHVNFLHEKGIVIGDISDTNAVWSKNCEDVFLIDCDSMRVEGKPSGLIQGDALNWTIPEEDAMPHLVGQRSFDSDNYKVALFVLRTLTQQMVTIHSGNEQLPELTLKEFLIGQGFSETRSRHLWAMWEKAKSSRGERPTAAEWINALSTQRIWKNSSELLIENTVKRRFVPLSEIPD